MGKLVKLTDEYLDKSKRYAKVYSYQVSSDIEPILLYKNIGDAKYIYHIEKPEVYKMRYVAEAIYAMLHERNKKKITINYVSDVQILNIDFYPQDYVLDIFRKLLKIEELYFIEKSN